MVGRSRRASRRSSRASRAGARPDRPPRPPARPRRSPRFWSRRAASRPGLPRSSRSSRSHSGRRSWSRSARPARPARPTRRAASLPRRSARGSASYSSRSYSDARRVGGGASLRRLDSPRRSPPLLPEPRSSEMRHPPAADIVTARGRDHAPGRAARKREHRRVAARRVSADAGRRRHSESSVIAGRASWCADRGEMTQREAAEPRTTTWAFAEDAMPRHKDPSYPRAPPAARSSCRRRTHTPRAR